MKPSRLDSTFSRSSRTARGSHGRHAGATLAGAAIVLSLLLCTPALSAVAAAGNPAPIPPPPPKSADRVAMDVEVRTDTDGDRQFIVVRKDGKSPALKWVGHSGAYLGVHLVELTPELRQHFGVPADAGVLIGKVTDESPALAAGLKVGDIVTAVDGEPVEGTWDMQRAIVEHESGTVVQLEVWRDGKVRTLEATLAERKRPALELGNMEMYIPAPPALDKEDAERWRGLAESYRMNIPIDEEKIQQMIREFEKQLEEGGFRETLLEAQAEREKALEKKLQLLEEKLRQLEKKLDK